MEGLDRLLTRIRGQRVGLVTGPSGWLGRRGHLLDLVAEQAELVALFAPEHGVWGDLQAGEQVSGGLDPRSGVPVHSLYGERRAPTVEMLADLDLVVGCLQDAGARPYTFKTTLAACLESCGKAGKPLLILDRPTPLGRRHCQGNVAAGRFFGAPLPMRPGLTIGEQLQWYRHHRSLDAELEVIDLFDPRPSDGYRGLDLPWLPPSPNLPTPRSALLFAATVVLEGTNLSEGRGTTLPFEQLGAPWLDGERLAAELNQLELPGLLARPAWFQPTFSKHAGTLCGGVQLHVLDEASFDPPAVGLHLLAALRRLWPEEVELLPGLDARYHTPAVRESLLADAAAEDLLAGWAAEAAGFQAAARDLGLGDGDGWVP